jgi:hypothetical protein
MIGRAVPGLDHQCLRINDVQAGYDATHYLIDLGIADMGRAVAQGLLQMLAGQPIVLPLFEAKLVICESAVMLRT